MARLRGEAVTTAQIERSDKLRPSRRLGHPKFVLAHHPSSWEFRDGRWLPRIKHHYIYPGVNGTDKNGNHAGMLAQLQMEGWHVFSHDVDVCYYEDGELIDDAGYMLRYDGTRGPIYRDVWSVPVQIGSGPTAKTVWEFDQEGFDAWRARLVDNGVVKPPNAHVVGDAVNLQMHRMSRDQSNAHMPLVAAQIKKETERYQAMQDSLKELSPAPSPKRKAKRGKATSV